MPIRKISKSVEDIESEAERILEEARTRANEILLKTKEEAKEILSSQLPMDEVKTECRRLYITLRQKPIRKTSMLRTKLLKLESPLIRK